MVVSATFNNILLIWREKCEKLNDWLEATPRNKSLIFGH